MSDILNEKVDLSALAYRLTSNAYYQIVSGARED